jgi:L-aminopeptidase/D-esterase-like protein
VHAAVERIGGDHQLFVGTRLQQRGVITDAEQDVVALEGAGADAVDEGEFGQGHGAFPFL